MTARVKTWDSVHLRSVFIRAVISLFDLLRVIYRSRFGVPAETYREVVSNNQTNKQTNKQTHAFGEDKRVALIKVRRTFFLFFCPGKLEITQ